MLIITDMYLKVISNALFLHEFFKYISSLVMWLPNSQNIELWVLYSNCEQQPGQCVFVQDTSLTHSALIHPEIKISAGTTELSAKPDEMQGCYLQWTGIQSWESDD